MNPRSPNIQEWSDNDVMYAGHKWKVQLKVSESFHISRYTDGIPQAEHKL